MTATIDAEPQIIKTDTRGRVQTSPERREQLLAEFERSGLSAPKFAALVGIKYPTFAAWAARRRRQQPTGNPAPPGAAPPHPMQWLEAVVTQADVCGPICRGWSVICKQQPDSTACEVMLTGSGSMVAQGSVETAMKPK